jgi:hypothetical protein
LSSVLSSPRVSLTWLPSRSASIGGAEARLIALLALAGRAVLGLTGELTFAWPGGGALPVTVSAKGPRAAVTEEQRDWLGGIISTLPDPRQVEFALIPAALDDAGARLELVEETAQVILTAMPR